MIFCILITTDSLSTINSCLKFIQTALDKSHTINTVYFRGTAIYQANNDIQFAYREFNYQNTWQTLKSANNIELLVCYSSMVKRGLKQSSLHHSFTFSGSSKLAEKIELADKFICFS
jgi:sulfur relay protein TusD/DsrE